MDRWLATLPVFMEGFRVTLILLAVSGVAAMIFGTIIAAMRISPIGSLRTVAAVWTEVARNTPLTLVFFFTAFVMPMLGVRLPYIVLAFIALTYYTAPFVAEALRSGINGVPLGQAEAARSVGLTFGQSVSLVILPQAFRMTIPPLINVFIALTKNTSVAGGFFVLELFGVTRQLANANESIVTAVLVTAAALYLVITVPLGVAATYLERKWVVRR